jgi:hypothetical protein
VAAAGSTHNGTESGTAGAAHVKDTARARGKGRGRARDRDLDNGRGMEPVREGGSPGSATETGPVRVEDGPERGADSVRGRDQVGSADVDAV